MHLNVQKRNVMETMHNCKSFLQCLLTPKKRLEGNLVNLTIVLNIFKGIFSIFTNATSLSIFF